jgi:hypothetical protein
LEEFPFFSERIFNLNKWFFSSAVPLIEQRALQTVGKLSATELHPQTFVFCIFETGSHYVDQAHLELVILLPQLPKLPGLLICMVIYFYNN